VEKFSTLTFPLTIYEAAGTFKLGQGGKDRWCGCFVPLFSNKCPERVESSLRFPHGGHS
jgi:hypothetical protein